MPSVSLFTPIFQYPLSDRAGCNGTYLDLSPLVLLFQYPLSDRAGCNWARFSPLHLQSAAFSILSRIERAVTRYCYLCCEVASLFQYPLSDRAGCNPVHCHIRVGFTTTTFSILSRIERAVTLFGFSSAPRRAVFQYPLSDRAGCNRPGSRRKS